MNVRALIPFFLCAGAFAGPAVIWDKVPANLDALILPDILRRASGSFEIIFYADISGNRLVNVRKIEGHPILVPDWSNTYIPKIVLGPSAKKTTGHFRLRINTSDPCLQQRRPAK
ncbi:hypothetical protein [Geothrix campi]|uniref:hypothetical protein n=1 Tax=Geothrix campi TaxID=2966450 RepID=UPI002147C3E8|nr:hypothetical protein [Geothrix sp. SG10]